MSEATWSQIEEAWDEGLWATVLELCERYVKQNPGNLHARIPQAIALRHLKQFDETVSLLKRTYADPNASSHCKCSCQREMGQAFEEMGNFDDARRAYEEAHRLLPESTIPLIYRGAMELHVGDFAAAREWLIQALQCPKGCFEEVYFNIGGAHLCERRYAEAIEHYQKALTINPDYDLAWERLADAKRAIEIREQSK